MVQKKKTCNGCNKPSYIWKSEGRSKFCQACWAKRSSASKPTKPRQSIKRSSTPIPKISDKKQKEDAIYKVLRLVYLKNHPTCEMSIKGICTEKGTTIQHLRGRCGKYYTDDRYFMSACLPCHMYANEHPEEAIQNGWAELRLKNYEE